MAVKDYSKLQSHEACPRFESCGVNKCPLHKDFHKLEIQEGDTEVKCTLPKSIRKRIGTIYKLQWQGLFQRELLAQEKWDSLPQDEKDRRVAKLKENRALSHRFRKGVPNTTIPCPMPSKACTNDEKTLNSMGKSDTTEGAGVTNG